jgi:proteasome alpha subunit
VDAVELGLKALKKATEEEKLNPKAVEIGIVRRGENFRRLDDNEAETYIQRVNAA